MLHPLSPSRTHPDPARPKSRVLYPTRHHSSTTPSPTPKFLSKWGFCSEVTAKAKVSCWSPGQDSYPGRETPLVEKEGPPNAVDLDVVPGVRNEELLGKARRATGEEG